MLSRLEPGKNADTEEKKVYRDLAGSVYSWYGDRKERKELEAAIGLYAYMVRIAEIRGRKLNVQQ